jgi:hypothetical protein
MYPPPAYGPQWPTPQTPTPAGPPGSVTTARVLLWIQGGFWALSAVVLLIVAVTRLGYDDFTREGGDSATRTGYAIGTLLPMAFCAALAIFGLTVAAKLRAGATGARICALLLEGVLIFFGILGAGGGIVFFVARPVAAALAIVLLSLLWSAFPGAVFGCLLTRRAREFLSRPV